MKQPIAGIKLTLRFSWMLSCRVIPRPKRNTTVILNLGQWLASLTKAADSHEIINNVVRYNGIA